MRVLVLGADGMLGHQVAASLRENYSIAGTVRSSESVCLPLRGFLPGQLFYDIDVRNFDTVTGVLEEYRPESVINCVGIVKQRDESKNSIDCLEINSLFPHRLAVHCVSQNIKVVHMSTDCIFSGRTGHYSDESVSDASDLYGQTKYLGEISDTGIYTLRTSIIGLELSHKRSLIEWFLSQSAPIAGYTNALYTGFTTLEMSRIIERVLTSSPQLGGVYNVSSSVISKYDLLCGLRDRLGFDLEIRAEDKFQCDRSLDSDRFRKMFSYTPPSWGIMLDELAQQITERKEMLTN